MCHYSENRTAYVRYKLNETTSMLKHESFRIGQLFKLYVSGWQEKINEAPTTIDIIDSFLSHQKENFVVLDYDKMAAEFYPFAVGNVEGVSIGKEREREMIFPCIWKNKLPSMFTVPL